MAQNDGSFHIDTGLDSSGFEKGSEKLLQAIKELTDAITNLGQTAEKLIGSTFTAPTLNSGALEDDLENITEQAETSGETLETAFSSVQTDEAEAAIERIAEKEQQIGESAESAASDMEDAYDGALQSVESEASEFADQAKQALSDALSGTEGADVIPDQMSKDEIAIGKAEVKLEKAKQALDDFASTPIPTDEYKQTTDAIEKAESALLKLYARKDQMEEMGVDESSVQWQKLQMQIRDTEAEVERMESAAARMRDGGTAFIDPTSTTRFRELQLAVADASQRLDELRSKNLSPLQAAVANIQSTISNAGRAVQNAFLHPFQTLGRVAGSTAGAVGNVAKSALSAGKSLAQAASEKIKKGLSSIASKFKNIGKNGSSAALSASKLTKTLTSLKTMVVSKIKRTFVSYLTSEMQEALKSLAKFDSGYDAAISGMRNATTELASNLASSLGTLIKSVAPYVTQAIQFVSGAVEKISALLASITGAKTVTVAKQQTASYADSLSDSADAANSAAKAQKNLNSTLSGFDQLHKIDSQSSSGSSSSVSSDKDLFETRSVDSVLGEMSEVGQGIIDRIRQGISEGDWAGVGQAIGDGMNVVTSSITEKIEAVRPVAEQWAANVAQGLSGIFETADGAKFGGMLASAVNLAFGVLNSFITNFDWSAMGAFLGDSISGLFLGIDWELLGGTFANGFNAVVNTLYAIITHIKWREIAGKFAAGLNKFIHGVDWGKAGQTLGELLKGVLGFIATAIEEIDWFALGESVKELLQGIDWNGVADALFEVIGAAFGGLLAFFCGLFEDVVEDLAEWWETNALNEEGKFTLTGFLEGIGEALYDIGQWIKDHIFQPFIDGFKKAFGIASPSKEMKEQGGYVADGLLEGIKNGWKAIPQWLGEKATALKESLSQKWENIKSNASEKWEGVKEKITSHIASAKTTVLTKAGVLKSNIAEKWDGIKSDASTKWESMKNDLTGTAESIRSKVVGKWDTLKTNTETKFNTLKTTAYNKFTKVKSKLGDVDFKSIGSGLVSGVESGINGDWAGFSGRISGLFSGITSTVKGVFGIHSPSKVFAGIGAYLVEGLTEGVKAEEQSAIKSVSTLAANMIDAASSEVPAIEMSGNGLAADLNQVADKLAAIARTFGAIRDALSAMGGLVVPQMAYGGVVPARVRIADGRSTADSRDTDAELLALLRKIITLLDGGNGGRPTGGTRVPIEVVSKIDRRELARALAEINISDGRITNGGSKR